MVHCCVQSVDRWLSVRLETLGAIIAGAASLLALLSVRSGSLHPAFAAFSVSLATGLTSILSYGVRVFVAVVGGLLGASSRLTTHSHHRSWCTRSALWQSWRTA